MKDVINRAVDDIKLMRDCPRHQWVGPIQIIEFPDFVDYQVCCKHCPLRKGVDTAAKAQALIL